ncbi:MAG: nicotinate-nucleotide adenylyltransferase [Alphaproteobacteria bacterium]
MAATSVAPRALGPSGQRIGLLGGSFNPAHDGHRDVSLVALVRLHLDRVWWLVSPQSPLKPTTGMAPLEERLAAGRKVARHPRIVVTDLERRLGTVYTADTLAELKRRFPRVRFVWLMGADALAELPRWHDWPAIFAAMPVAIFDRAPYAQQALAGKAARRFARWRLGAWEAPRLADLAPPAWVFLHGRCHPASGTALRAASRGRA